MLAVLSTLENIVTHLRVGACTFEIACLNAPKEVVLSGTADDMSKAAEILNGQGIKATLLKVPYAFHSSQVEPVLEEFEALAAGCTFRKPVVPVISPLLATSVTESNVIGPNYLGRHCRETVNLEGALSAAKTSKGINDDTIFVEFGPHPVVSGLVKANLGQQIRTVSSMRRNKGTWQPLTSALASLYTAGVDIQWAEYHRDFPWSHCVLQLPAYNWDLKDYWIQYVNDWSLRKGDALPIMPAHFGPTLSTTTVHKLVEETGSGDELTVVVESDISRPDLNPLVQGHRVNGIPLCTPVSYQLPLGTLRLISNH
jgi:acyl transferase domain-containing protein